MELGLSITPPHDHPPSLRLRAIRALRPALVRIPLTDPTAVDAWIALARERSLRVLWCVPLEDGGPRRWHQAAKALVSARAAGVTAGIEIGVRFEHRDVACGVEALAPPDWLAWVQTITRTIRVCSFPAFAGLTAGLNPLPMIVQTRAGCCALHDAETRSFLARAALTPGLCRLITGISVPPVTMTALPAARLRRFAMRAERLCGWRLALTSVGWRLGIGLSRRQALREAGRDLGVLCRPRWRRTLDAETRDRWLLDAVDFARINASHLLITPDATIAEGVRTDRWPFFDEATGLADPIWRVMHRRALRTSDRLREPMRASVDAEYSD